MADQSPFSIISKNIGESSSKKILFVGGGNMATALIDGCIKTGFTRIDDVAISCRSKLTYDKWKSKGFSNVFTSSKIMIENFPDGILVFAVKPQLRHSVYDSFQENTCILNRISVFISILAGVTISTLSSELKRFGFIGEISRLMPNTPACVGEGASLIAHNDRVGQYQRDIVKALVSGLGVYVDIPETNFDAAAAVASCSPAWAFMFIESLSDGGVLNGLSRSDSITLAAQALRGAATMVLQTGEHPGVLKDKVCSPGGTTIAGVRELEKAGFRSSVIEAVKAANDRAKQL